MRSIFTLAIIIAISIFFSCSKKQDNNVNPTVGPISIGGIHEADTVKGIISAPLAIAGSTQPVKIEVYANDSLITTVNKAPYSLQWNTLAVINGNYKLKAIAYDNAGKETQTTLDVIVHNILVTLEIDPHLNNIYTNIMYIVTDSAGVVLNSLKYNGTDKFISVAATKPNLKSRCNAFEVKTNLFGQTYITAYMNIPKGSIWNLRGLTENLDPQIANAKISLSDIPSFRRLTSSSDLYGFTYVNLTDIGNVTNFLFSRTGKQYVQYVDKSGNGYYHFFDVDTVNKTNVIDLAANNFQPSIKKTVVLTNGATSANLTIYGKSDKNYDDYYLVDSPYVNGSELSYFYPDGTYLTNYISNVYYTQNGWNYSNVYTNLPPETVAPFGTTITITSSSLSPFSFSAQGSLDYYSANFYSASDNSYIFIYSPSAYKSFQFPDILKLTNLSGVPLSNFKITSFSMYKTPGFDESKLTYYANEYPGIAKPSQAAIKYFQ